nr:copper homeostasis protein CutC [Elizabethkingia argenteiflava]
MECGFSHLLTSGGAPSALEGLEKLRYMQTEIGEKLNILVGGGVRSSNVGRLKKYFRAIHSACITDGTEYIDAEELKALKTLITNPVL